MPSKRVASRLCSGGSTTQEVGAVVPAPFPVTITLTRLGNEMNRPPSFLSLLDFFFPSPRSPFSKFSHTRGIHSLHIHLKTTVFYLTLYDKREYP
ncbi:uncharacterized protein N7500_006661 [Penicillium coprophilum]|uniref:uncharacterized protein n=1 Tax=Penicillium coprophilum TaxID=36646 RepID=UPI00238E0D13|nr:uncharacterized protein N7500_006661 [Penicillium coprophilum]KAJ5164831.1 hypothetical protein N7500_006661 [Penicillium coprophilum]